MLRTRLFRVLPAIFSAFVIASCSDSGVSGPLAPLGSVQDQGSDSGSGSGSGSDSDSELSGPSLTDSAKDAAGLKLKAAWWDKDLEQVVRVRKTIGPLGGEISIPETGLKMSFPAGAVAAPITITVTADEKYVAYKMEPAGTQFLKNVTVTQSLAQTEFGDEPLRDPLFAAYIDDKVQLSGWVPVLELAPSQTIFSPTNPLIPIAHVWFIRHFSRYMLASG
jgi:hypothetical protein